MGLLHGVHFIDCKQSNSTTRHEVSLSTGQIHRLRDIVGNTLSMLKRAASLFVLPLWKWIVFVKQIPANIVTNYFHTIQKWFSQLIGKTEYQQKSEVSFKTIGITDYCEN